MLGFSLICALQLATLALAGTNNYLNLYSDQDCATNYAEVAIIHNEQCYNSLPSQGQAKAIAGVLVENGCYILAYEQSDCTGTFVNVTSADGTTCFNAPGSDAYFQGFLLKNCY